MTDNLSDLSDYASENNPSLVSKILHHAQVKNPQEEILYAFLTDAEARPIIASTLKTDWFSSNDVSFCMRILLNAYNSGKPIDSHEIHVEIHSYIRNIDFTDCIGEFWHGSIHTLRKDYEAMRIRETNIDGQKIVMNPHLTNAQKASRLNSLYIALHDEVINTSDKNTKEKLIDTIDYLHGCLSGEIDFVTWGIDGLDQYMKLRKNCCYFVGALPATGKTSFAISAIIKQCRLGKRIFFWCGEMTEEQIFTRIISQLTGYPLDVLENHNHSRSVTAEILNRIKQAVDEIASWKLHTICGRDMTFKEISSEIRTLHLLYELDCIWLDYYSDILPREELSNNPRHEQMADINKDVKSLKKELPVPIIQMAQIKREAVDRYPRKTDLAESSSCERIADGILLLDKPIQGKDVNERNYWINGRQVKLEEIYGKCAVVIGKNRFGPECVSIYNINAELMQFLEEDDISKPDDFSDIEIVDRRDING
jgi:replicative DNA helicase